jgi:hypothetical protein
VYDPGLIKEISHKREALFAINVKGLSDEEWRANTRKEPDWARFWHNLEVICEHGDLRSFYVTYTNCASEMLPVFERAVKMLLGARAIALLRDAYSIPLIGYDALVHVDDRPWGAALYDQPEGTRAALKEGL